MLLEIHCHTAEHSSCSHAAALDLAKQIYRNNLQGVVITDHHFLWPDEELKRLRKSAGLPEYFVVLSGQETTTSDAGDVLVYGAALTIPPRMSLASIRAAHPDAAIILAHPYRDGKRPSPERLLNSLIDGVEIFNSNHSVSDNVRGLSDWRRYKFRAVAGTDTHGVSYAGSYPTHFDHPVETIGDLVEALKNGGCRPSLIEAPKAKQHVRMEEVGFGAEQEERTGGRIIIKEFRDMDGWSQGQRAFHIMSEFGRHGFGEGRFRVPRAMGDDGERMTTIEQSLPGVSLYEKVTGCDRKQAKAYVRLSAQWLARLHNLGLRITSPHEFFETEAERMGKYVKHFAEISHPYTSRIREIAEAVVKAEKDLFEGRIEKLVQGHGDYHPKNILIGRENPDDAASAYVGAIDFDRSSCLPPAFDVGNFVAQFRNQLLDYPDILRDIPEEIFVDAYLAAARWADSDFLNQVELFRARSDLSIASFLIQIGLGTSENVWRVLVEAERALTRFEAGRHFGGQAIRTEGA